MLRTSLVELFKANAICFRCWLKFPELICKVSGMAIKIKKVEDE